MSKMKRLLNVSDGIHLINSCIKDTPLQKKLIDWKLKYKIYSKNYSDLGMIVNKYWKGFMIRNAHRLHSKIGRKYAVDTSIFKPF